MRFVRFALVSLGLTLACGLFEGCSVARVPMSVVKPAYSYLRDPLARANPFTRPGERDDATTTVLVNDDVSDFSRY